MKESSYDDIRKAVDSLLKVNSSVKRKKKAYLFVYQDKLFSFF